MLCDIDSSNDDLSEVESLLDDEPCTSLFDANATLPSVEDCLRYDAEQHRFDLRQFRRQHQLAFYDVVKLVNFIRAGTAQGCKASAIIEQISGDARPWDDERYLKPAIENDPMLFALDGDSSDADDSDDDDVADLKAENVALRAEIQKMKETFKTALGLDDDKDGSVPSQKQITNAVAEKDREYFSGYSHVDIHEEMLRDTARTEAYQAFCDRNRHLFEGKVVLDVGCGSGILCLFAARAGARRVIGIDNAEIVHKARLAIARNGYSDIVEIIQGKVEEIELDCKVDLIISEWMGYFLLFESMLSSVLIARDRFLVDPFFVYPDQAALFVAGAQTRSFANRRLGFWKDLYGFDMSDIGEVDPTLEQCRNSGRAWVATLPSDAIFTDSALIKQIDIGRATDTDLDFSASFTIRATRDETLDAIVSYFSVDFAAACHNPVRLTTAPDQPYTHWKQTIFMLSEPIALKCGQIITGQLKASRPSSSPRSYDVLLELEIDSCKLSRQCFGLTV